QHPLSLRKKHLLPPRHPHLWLWATMQCRVLRASARFERGQKGTNNMAEWLRRSAAPISEKVWKAIDETAISMAKQTLVGRRLADLDGPRGWQHVATQPGTFRSASVQQSEGNVRFS